MLILVRIIIILIYTNSNIFVHTGGAIITTGEFGSLQNYSLLQNISCSDTASETTLGDCVVYEADCLPLCPGTNIGLRCFGVSLHLDNIFTCFILLSFYSSWCV